MNIITNTSLIFRIVLNIILMFFCFSQIISWKFICKCFLYTNNFEFDNEELENENRRKYQEFKQKQTNGLVIFSHSTCFDHYFIYNTFQETLPGIVSKKHAFFPFNKIFESFGSILFEKGSNTAQLLKDRVHSRKQNEPLLCIAPAGGFSHPTDQNKLEEYKIGAFLPMSPVLPIIIKTDPYFSWKIGQSLYDFVREVLTTNKKNNLYVLKAIDPIYPKEDETPELFKERVKEIMQNEMTQIDVNKENESYFRKKRLNSDSNLLIMTSFFCLLLPSLFGLFFKKWKVSIPIFLIGLFTLLTHLTNDVHYEFLNRINLKICLIFLLIICYNEKLFLPISFAIISNILFYSKTLIENDRNEFDELFIVHLPVFISFLTIIFFYKKKSIN